MRRRHATGRVYHAHGVEEGILLFFDSSWGGFLALLAGGVPNNFKTCQKCVPRWHKIVSLVAWSHLLAIRGRGYKFMQPMTKLFRHLCTYFRVFCAFVLEGGRVTKIRSFITVRWEWEQGKEERKDPHVKLPTPMPRTVTGPENRTRMMYQSSRSFW